MFLIYTCMNGTIAYAKSSATGTRTRVARVKAEYPNQLDYSGSGRATPRLGLVPRGWRWHLRRDAKTLVSHRRWALRTIDWAEKGLARI